MEKEEKLLSAVKTGDLDKVKELALDPKLQIDWQDPKQDGRTALHLACEHGFAAVTKVLIARMAQLDPATKSGTNPVYIAAAHGRVAIVRYLAEIGVDAAEPSLIRSIDGRSPVNAAAQIGLDEALHWLLQPTGTNDAQVADLKGWSPIHCVCQRGHTDCLLELLNAGVDPNQLSKLQNFVDCRRLITLPRSGDATDPRSAASTDETLHRAIPSWSPLHVAAHYGQTSSIRMLLQYGGDLFASDESAANALQAAALTGRSETVGFLLGEIREHANEEELPRIIAPAVLASCCLGHADALLRCLASAGEADPGSEKVSFQGLSAMADVLESLMQNRLSNPRQQKACVVGSFSEGWGGSFSCLNGNIEADSDIDFTTVRLATMFHLEGFCKCSDEDRQLEKVVKYDRGHVVVTGFRVFIYII